MKARILLVMAVMGAALALAFGQGIVTRENFDPEFFDGEGHAAKFNLRFRAGRVQLSNGANTTQIDFERPAPTTNYAVVFTPEGTNNINVILVSRRLDGFTVGHGQNVNGYLHYLAVPFR